MGLNVNLNAGEAQSQSADPHVQAQRASVCHFSPPPSLLPPPALFIFLFVSPSPPKMRSNLRQRRRETGGDARCLLPTRRPRCWPITLHTVSLAPPTPRPHPTRRCSRPEVTWLVEGGRTKTNKTCYLCYLSLGWHHFSELKQTH